MNILGLRLGNSNASAFVSCADRPEPLQVIFEDGQPLLPTAVAITKDGSWLVGKRAINLRLLNPVAVTTELLRKLDRPVRLLNREYESHELLARVIAEVRRRAEGMVGEIRHCVLSAPGYFNASQMDVLLRAAKTAGLDVVQFIADPIAEVIGAELPEDVHLVLIVRMGGHSLDVAILSHSSSWRLVSLGGISTLGGMELDKAIADWFLDRQPKCIAEEIRSNEAMYLQVLSEAEQSKMRLSSHDYTRLGPVLLKGRELEEKILSRQEFETLVWHILESAQTIVARTIQQAGIRSDDLNAFLLTGGSANIPAFRQMLESTVGMSAIILPTPELVSARGAALVGRTVEVDASSIKLKPSREEFNGSLAEARNILWFLRDTGIAGKYERLLDEIEEMSRYAWEKQDAREWQQEADKLETAVQQVFDLMRWHNPNLFYAMVFRWAIQLWHEDHVEQALEVAKHIPPSFQDYDEVLQFIDKCFNRLREQRQRLAPLRGGGNPEIPGGMVDQVHFTVTSPSLVRPSDSFVVDIWAHLERQREEVIRRAREAFGGGEIHIKSKGPVEVARGSVLSVRLKLEEFVVENSEDTILWNNEIGNATFLVTVPRSVTEGPKSGLATIHVNGLQIARIYFIIHVGKTLSDVNHIPTRQEQNRKAFASYASADRDEVLARVQGIQKVAPQLDVFLDVVSLRSGQYWEQELWKIIPSNDVFYLFWSHNAAKSQWVEKEWRCALKMRGLDFIDPVPLVSPEKVPPPPELASKHFNDWVLAYMRGKRQ